MIQLRNAGIPEMQLKYLTFAEFIKIAHQNRFHVAAKDNHIILLDLNFTPVVVSPIEPEGINRNIIAPFLG